MTRLLLSLLLVFAFIPQAFCSSDMQSGDRKSFRASDGASIDAIIGALYACVSGPAGPRDWKRFQALFIPDARLEAVIWRGEGDLSLRVFSVEEYTRRAGEYFKTNGFYEKEIARKVDTFGSIAQVFSTYEGFASVDAPVPLKRGINSMQLFNDGNRWWIVSILWEDERQGVSIPSEYLPGG
ncbi:MAG: hypothetical protein IH600_11125 [Bacteroidetes bacterium]|nr:hypothetical protein [Bacteroidota bacterium]